MIPSAPRLLGTTLASVSTLLAGPAASLPDGADEPTGQPSIQSVQVNRVNPEGETVEFRATASDPDGGALIDTWDFGDGTDPRSGSGLSAVTHRYVDDAPEEYEGRLTVQSTSGETATMGLPITVNNLPPVIQFMDWDGFPRVDVPLQFTSAASDPGPADVLTYTWDFGDGETASGPFVEHAFDEEGTYAFSIISVG